MHSHIQSVTAGVMAALSSPHMYRARVRDNFMTIDARSMVMDNVGVPDGPTYPIHPGKPLSYGHINAQYGLGVKVHDGRVYDSTGAFLVGELERLDLALHKPLMSVSWGRDIDLREDVTLADEVSSFTLSTYASSGGLGAGNSIGNGKAWIGKTADQIGGVGVDIAKVTGLLRLWGLEIKYTIPELESAAKLGRPIDQQKMDALNTKYQMDVDEQVYIGDTSTGDTGLINSARVTNINNLVAGALGTTTWVTKTPTEILTDVNTAINSVWTASGWEVMPAQVRIPPAQFGFISTQLISIAGSMSILKYLKENSLLTTTGNGTLDIQPLKWAIGAGVGGTIGTLGTVDRMTVYTKAYERIRYPMTALQRTPLQYDSLFHKCTYFGRLGQVETVYPETVGYFDGL